MKNFTAKCGCSCNDCPTYKDNITTVEKRKNCSAGWAKYLNIKLSPEKLRACDGCSLPDSERRTFYLNCIIRKCAMENDVENCAYCSIFSCDELKRTHSLENVNSKEEYTEKLGKPISDKDYLAFIEPYQGMKHLLEIRKKLHPDVIIAIKQFSSKIKTTDIPEKIQQTDNNYNAITKIHSLLTTLDVGKDISLARFLSLKKRRPQLINMLWAIGLNGTFIEKPFMQLELDSKTFFSYKINGMYPVVLQYIEVLKKHDVFCEIVTIDEKVWLTPAKGLRKQGWVIRMHFGQNMGGDLTLTVFKDYVTKLDNKYKSRAINYFSAADLKVILS